MSRNISVRQKASLERMIKIAQSATGPRVAGSEISAELVARNFGGFLTSAVGGGPGIAADMKEVFWLVAQCRVFPTSSAMARNFRRIVQALAGNVSASLRTRRFL